MKCKAVFLLSSRSQPRPVSCTIFLLALMSLFGATAGCGGNSSGGKSPGNETPPANLVYPQTTIAATIGQAIANNTPTVTGTVTSYSVSPTLPPGLSLNATTGTLSGTPTSATPQATYTITATNSAGSTTATVSIVVNPPPPTNLVYPQTTIAATVGQSIATDTPTVTGTVTSFTVSPALPAGLSLNASTGAISGTPTAVTAQATYTITAANSAGSTTATLKIAVNPAPPTNLVYPQPTIAATVGQAITTDTPTVTGTATSFTVSPTLPAGLSLNATTGAISGTPTSHTAQATYTITAANSAGSTIATVQIAVNPPPPTNLVYPQTTIAATVGQAITTDTPTVTGTVTSYTISPALPAGLSLDATTGAISGTPTSVITQATYTITAANSAGSTTATVQIAVNPPPPTNLVYPQTTIVATVGQSIPTDTPTVTGTATSYTVSPALPAGLSLNATTGAISGTPTSATPQATYTVTAANSTGSTTATVQIVVNLAPPTNLVYPQTTIAATVTRTIPTDTPTVTGTVTTYTVSPALPAGLSLDASTGAVSGTPTSITSQATYTVTATNSAGSTTANLTITVASFSAFTLLDLGHANSLAVMRLQPTRLFSQDTSGHWALWDYTATTELASGDPATLGLISPYPADMAGSVLAIGTANAVEIRSNTDGSLITTLTSPNLDPVPFAAAWWKLSADGTYIASGYASGLSVWSTTDGHLLFSRTGDYSRARAFAAAGQLQIGLGPAGNNVIETDSVPSGTSSTGPAFTANFNSWFTDGSHFFTNTPNLSPPNTPPVYDVYTYSAATVQQGMLSLGYLNFTGYANWFWTYPVNVLSVYPIGATTPTATYTLSADTAVIPSGSTLGVLPYGTPAASTIDISGTTPTLSTAVNLPVAYESAFAALSPAQWAVGNQHGVVLDGPSATTTPRFFGYGNAFSIAGAPGHATIATAIGKILDYDPASQTILSTINFTSSKLALSTDGTVLAAKASDIDSQYEPDRTLNIYSLPAGTVTSTFPYQLNDQSPATPFLFDYSLSSSGTALGQYLGTYNGLYFDYTRQVTPIPGSPIVWSDNPPSGVYDGTTPILLSPDGTLVAVSTGDYSSTSTTSIYKNGVLAATVNGFAVGWIDNNRVLVNTFGPLGTHVYPPYLGAVIYDATGTQLTTLTALPQLPPAGQSLPLSTTAFFPVDSNSIYSPYTYTIYSLTTGAATWTEPLPHPGTTTVPYSGASAVSGNYIVFTSGAHILVDLP
ncbi:beta strand repeat-containing protein [Tunturiibacter gelidoferens]|uniref:Ig domain-containing protein n=1 Tax=Tunturiibacter gelidiferens TaxID=3069689 RepID=A0AAU7Z394_9BACT